MKATKVLVTNIKDNTMTQFFESEGSIISSIKTVALTVTEGHSGIHTLRKEVDIDNGNVVYSGARLVKMEDEQNEFVSNNISVALI